MIQRGFQKAAVVAAIIFTCAAITFSAASGKDFAGKDGRGIVAEIISSWQPQRYASSENDLRECTAAYARKADGRWRDYFGAEPLRDDAVSLQHIVPAAWWGGTAEAAADLHNIVPANREADDKRSDYPPGIVTEPDYDNGFWRAGTGLLSGIEAGFYEPADGLKGDFARVFMYMSVIYSCELWHGRAPMIYVDGGYPCLNAYGRETLLEWHRADPVDDAELARDRVIAAFQGCGNPFVSQPELAEYIWGAHSGETYPQSGPGENPEDPDDPDNPDTPGEDEPGELKGEYSLSADRAIGLRSPYVPANVSWTFDGRAVSGNFISLEGVSPGKHELKYQGSGETGRIIITVTE